MVDRRVVLLASALLSAAVWLLALRDASPALSGVPAGPEPGTNTVDRHPVAEPPGGRTADPIEPWLYRMALQGEAPQDEETDGAEEGSFRHGALKGRVVWREEPWSPVRDLTVELTRSWLDTVLPADPGALLTTRGERVRAVTDAQGRFVLGPAPTDGELFLLLGKGTEWHDFQKARELPRRGQIVDLGDVLLDQRGAVTGRVVGPDGEPVPQVEVRAVDDPMLDGDVHSDELRQARRAGLARFRLDGMAKGEPVPDAVVRRDAMLPFPRTTTDPQGRFLLRGLRPGQHDLFLHCDTHVGASRSILVAALQTTHLGEIELRKARSSWGRVVTGSVDGEPVVGGRVAAVSKDFAIGPRPDRTDAHGEFVLSGLDPELPYDLVFQYPEGGPWIRPEEAGDPDRHYVVPARSVLRFRLVDHAGRVVGDGDMRLLVRGGALHPRDTVLPHAFQPKEEARGHFVVAVPAGFHSAALTAVAWAPGHGTAVAQIHGDRWRQARLQDLPIVLLPAFPVYVFVTDDEATPIPRARVLVDIAANEDMDFVGSDWGALVEDKMRLGRTDEAGRFVAAGMWPASITFATTHPDYIPSPARTVVPHPGLSLQLVLQRPARIVGQLTEERRHVARRFRIAARPNWPENHELSGNPFLRPQQVWSNDDGTFSVPQLHPGLWLLRPLVPPTPSIAGLPLEHEQYLPLEVLLEPGQEMHLDLEMVARRLELPALAGNVLVDGAPGAGLVVRLKETLDRGMLRLLERVPAERRTEFLRRYHPELFADARWLHAVTTDSFGGFGFYRLEPGPYVLRLERPWQGRMQVLGTVLATVPEPGRHRRRVAEPPPEPLAIELQTGSLMATLHDRRGAPLPGRMVRVRQAVDGGADLVLLTDARGDLRFEGIPAGDYEVRLVTGGTDEELERIQVTAGQIAAFPLFANR